MKLDHLPFSAATTRRDFRTRRDFFASMETVFEHENGLKSRLVVAAEDGNCAEKNGLTRSVVLCDVTIRF